MKHLGPMVALLIGSLFSAIVRAETPAAEAPALRVGTSGDYPPFSFHDAAGASSGFDIVVAQRLAADLGRRLELVPFRWPELTAAVQAGRFDIAMSGVTVRADRAVRIAFSRPYAITGAVALIRDADRARFRHLDDLDRAGVRIGVNRGGHLEQVARQHFAHAQLVIVSDNGTLPDLLQQGTVEAVISEPFEAHTWKLRDLHMLAPFTRDEKAYALRRDAGALRRQVDDWLAAREADGWLNEQRRRWLGDAAQVTPAQAGIEALVTVMNLRLQLMPYVATIKRRVRLPIHDAAQEARVIERVRSAATAAGLNADDVAALFVAQMDAAKAIEEHAPPAPDAAPLSLDDVRAALGGISEQIIAELARCRAWLPMPQFRTDLDHALRKQLAAPGLTTAALDPVVRTATQVRPAH